ncbi:MAG TPA: hypothetical protein GX497_01710, partial [Bacillus bacterium]|nr:hypothetical protein [Bacillus sp. (in: firmicutes)]
DGITDIQGDLVKMEGWVKAAVPMSKEEEDEEEDELGAAVLGMLPVTGGGGIG